MAATKPIRTDHDFQKVAKIIDALMNPLTISERDTLAGSLGVDHKGLLVWVKDLNGGTLQGWDGVAFSGSSDRIILSLIAGQNLSSGRAVIQSAGKVYYFNPNDVTHAGRVIGITTTSGVSDGAVSVQINGTITDAGFFFTVDKPVFISTDGALTTTVPSGLLVQKAGVSIAATKMKIEFDTTLIRI